MKRLWFSLICFFTGCSSVPTPAPTVRHSVVLPTPSSVSAPALPVDAPPVRQVVAASSSAYVPALGVTVPDPDRPQVTGQDLFQHSDGRTYASPRPQAEPLKSGNPTPLGLGVARGVVGMWLSGLSGTYEDHALYVQVNTTPWVNLVEARLTVYGPVVLHGNASSVARTPDGGQSFDLNATFHWYPGQYDILMRGKPSAAHLEYRLTPTGPLHRLELRV